MLVIIEYGSSPHHRNGKAWAQTKDARHDGSMAVSLLFSETHNDPTAFAGC